MTGLTGRLEFRRGALRDAYVETAFLSRLEEVIPDEVVGELDTLALSDVEQWATRHGINAPCVLKHYSGYCQGGWTKYRGFEFEHGASWRGPAIPDQWLQCIGTWDQRPLDRWFLNGVYADLFFATEAERRELKRRDPERWRVLSKNPFRRDEARERCLPPISTDPARESLEEFLIRARLHWLARAQTAVQGGFREARRKSSWPTLRRDCAWSVRYQFNKESYETIAGDATDPESVKKAVDRLSRAIRLKRPRGRAASKIRRQ